MWMFFENFSYIFNCSPDENSQVSYGKSPKIKRHDQTYPSFSNSR